MFNRDEAKGETNLPNSSQGLKRNHDLERFTLPSYSWSDCQGHHDTVILSALEDSVLDEGETVVVQ